MKIGQLTAIIYPVFTYVKCCYSEQDFYGAELGECPDDGYEENDGENDDFHRARIVLGHEPSEQF